jgi:uncharacterized membrane protein
MAQSEEAPRLPVPAMHAVLAFATLPLFLGAALSDWAYAASYQVQWTNFASWLNAAGVALAVLALVWAAVGAGSAGAGGDRRAVLYLVLLLAVVLLGVSNALLHARDGWAAMPAGLVLSLIVLLLAAAASAVGLAGMRRSRVAA